LLIAYQAALHFNAWAISEMKQWIFLSVAILSEVIATSTLKATGEFTRVLPSIIVVVGYTCSFYFLTLTLRTIPIGIAYAIWSGVGVSLIALAAWVFYGQELDLPAFVGIALIVAGVVVLNVFSKALPH
jgi:small multidrug resistance pump